ncbi:MAG: alpha/beta hydrolase [Gemmatimonadaceae bacterium]
MNERVPPLPLAVPALAVRAVGPTNAPTILFLHGGGVGGWMWQPVIERLPDFQCLAPDQPEHGGSRGIGPFSIEFAAVKMAELIRERVPGGRAHVVGLSEGAQIVVQLLAAASEIVDKAIVSSALVRPVPGWGWAASPTLLAWTHRLTVRPFLDADWWIRLNMKYAAGVPAEFFAEFKRDFQQLTESELVNLIVANQRFRLPAGLERVEVATLVVAGRKEGVAMRQSVRDLVAALPRATGGSFSLGNRVSAAMEHNWALTAPELFARTVRAWIDGGALPPEISDMA